MVLVAIVGSHMRQIPNLNDAVVILQVSCGVVMAYGMLILPGVTLAVITYRLERPAEITQALNDFFWFSFMLPWPTFVLQCLALAYAILQDTRPRPVFPKAAAYINIVAPLFLIPSFGMHFVKDGPLAWNGAITFWVAIFAFGLPVVGDILCLTRAVVKERPVRVTDVVTDRSGFGTKS
ncbi:hypothetical protein CP532_0623 [Ophiocordyceps camponoti-leonardi (nom. inval.)]|nr:hypothetical protein CP532_0623 [Ophiocordyceps camponoti-leonardi (nom. inval.)]